MTRTTTANFSAPIKAGSKATSMADLLLKQKTQFVNVSKGQIVKAKVKKLSSAEILLDFGGKTEAVVLEKDKRILKNLLRLLTVGQEVMATVLNPESDMGFTVVSLRHFADEALWKKLEAMQAAQQPVEVEIKEVTRGGYLVEAEEGITGFLPNSHVSFNQNQANMVGQKLKVILIDLSRELRKVIFSQKATLGTTDFNNLTKNLKIGQKIMVTVTSITPFGIFISLPCPATQTAEKQEKFLDGLIHISEISWEKMEDLSNFCVVGEKLEAVIIAFDSNAKRVDLSIKRLSVDPFEDLVKHYTVDQKITALVTKVMDAGVLFEVGQGKERIEAMMRKDKIPPTIQYKLNQKVQATVAQIDSRKRRLILLPVLKEKPLGYR